ncbi:YdcF family protein [Nostoc sp.]|uniref:YdcF family protein n=1 Tax=Nostoc sp. TaxID=1180 RepID=UPI002FF692D7
MFLYLSKLLPLFFYPLGLACVSLVVALVTLWKQPRTAAIAIAFSLTLLLFCSNAWIAKSLVRSLQIFQHQGINVIPAPTDFLVSEGELQELGSTPKAAILNLLPDTDNLHQFTIALKEYIGSFVYRLRGWL